MLGGMGYSIAYDPTRKQWVRFDKGNYNTLDEMYEAKESHR
jgi:hypothetical protein